jgi:hypothetical protein
MPVYDWIRPSPMRTGNQLGIIICLLAVLDINISLDDEKKRLVRNHMLDSDISLDKAFFFLEHT